MDDFADFFAATRDGAFRAVFAATGNRAAAEDAVAEAYARGYAEWHELRAHPTPIAWILRTALNVHRSVWRRLRREVLGTAPPDRPSPVNDSTRLDASIRRAVASLPRRQREVVAMRLLADLSAEETGAILGMAAATVHVHLHRALAKLRERLGSTGGGTDAGGHAAAASGKPDVEDVVEFGMVVRYAF
jgi:RNA polymerase sigma factor (sigma-70 family)